MSYLVCCVIFFFFKQKTAYEMRISDWSSDVCSSDLMLSPASSQLLMSIMSEAKTGPQRIKGGVPAGWHYLHKTGTGQELGARSTGFNDIGIMTAPDGTSYAVAAMIGSTTEPIPTRWPLMQAVAKAVAANHAAR